MSKVLDIMQWSLFILAVTTLLFVSWKIALVLLVIDGVIGLARLEWI